MSKHRHVVRVPEPRPLRSDFSLITDTKARDHVAWDAFVEKMQGREYGRSALNTAWSWFRSGWEARNDRAFADTERERSTHE
jgi:hypothetical protein